MGALRSPPTWNERYIRRRGERGGEEVRCMYNTCACAMETRQDILSDTTKVNASWRGRGGDRTRLG